jgi:putative peptidoglycan lipid II flippase
VVATAADLSPDARDVTVRRAAVMSVGTLLSRITGLLRVTVTVSALGFTALSDAYTTANTTPNILYELALGGVLTSVFVPLLVDWATVHGRVARDEAGSRFLTLVLVVLSALVLVGILLAPQIMGLYLNGVDDPVRRAQELEAGTFLLRWFLPQIVFYGLGAVAGGLLQADRRFAPPMFAPVVNNVAVIVTMLVFIAWRDGAAPTIETVTTPQLLLLGIGTTLGVVGMTAALWPALRSTGFRWRLRVDWAHETVRRLVRLGRWVVLYVAANQIVLMVVIALNHRIGEGVYTAYAYAFIFFSLPHAIVSVSIVTAILTGMAERWSRGERDGVRDLFSQGLRDTLVLMLPAAAGYLALAGPIAALFADYGAGAGAEDLMAEALAGFAIGLPFFSAFQLLTRTFYATQDSRTPAFVNISVGAVNLIAGVALAFGLALDITGLALGHAASYMAGSLLLGWLLRRRLGGIDGRRVAGTVSRTLPAAIAAGLVAWGIAELVAATLGVDRPAARLLQVGLAVFGGVLAFLAGALMFRVREVDEVRGALGGRFRR